MLAPCSARSRLNERRCAPALTAPARVAADNGQAGTKEPHPARTKALDDEASKTEEPRRGLREETERWRSVFPATAYTGDPNGPLEAGSANQISGALISMMVRSNQLQLEAGYIDARSLSQINDPSCDARPCPRRQGKSPLRNLTKLLRRRNLPGRAQHAAAADLRAARAPSRSLCYKAKR